jgi:glycerol-3-phosphate O-acyltransferase
MDKKLTPEAQLLEELLEYQAKGLLPPKYAKIALSFVHSYAKALQGYEGLFASAAPTLRLYFQLVLEQIRSPHSFEPYHKKIRHPIDYYAFSLDFLRPLIDLKRSSLLGNEHLLSITAQLKKGENVIFLANHQIEADPQAIAILLEKTHPELGGKIIYVAGERVVTDPMAVPSSLGCDLLCIYSKRYIDNPPELKAKKQQHNKNTMELMSRLLAEGGKAIYVAPSGGRDRKNGNGEIRPAPFDPQSVAMFYLMAKKGATATHFYPLALDTYTLLPPPDQIQHELGEERIVKRDAIGLALGPEFDMNRTLPPLSKEEQRARLAHDIWSQVDRLYTSLQNTRKQAGSV